MTRYAQDQAAAGRRGISEAQADRYEERLAYDVYEVISSVLDLQSNFRPEMPEDAPGSAYIQADPSAPDAGAWTKRSAPERSFHARLRSTGNLTPQQLT